jgi:hypothetical protein
VVVSHCPDLTRAAIGAHVPKSLHPESTPVGENPRLLAADNFTKLNPGVLQRNPVNPCDAKDCSRRAAAMLLVAVPPARVSLLGYSAAFSRLESGVTLRKNLLSGLAEAGAFSCLD